MKIGDRVINHTFRMYSDGKTIFKLEVGDRGTITRIKKSVVDILKDNGEKHLNARISELRLESDFDNHYPKKIPTGKILGMVDKNFPKAWFVHGDKISYYLIKKEVFPKLSKYTQSLVEKNFKDPNFIAFSCKKTIISL